MPYYQAKYGKEITQKVLKLADRTHFQLNQQHQVVLNGTGLDKINDEKLPDGRRVVWYIPHELCETYNREIADRFPLSEGH